MNADLENARHILLENEYTCVLCLGRTVRTCRARGIRPLVELLEEGGFSGYSAADKVVGKATAFLYVLLGVKEVYAPVASESAARVLRRHGIDLYCDLTVPAIFNRSRTGFCPMETAVRDIEDPQAAHAAIMDALRKMLHHNS